MLHLQLNTSVSNLPVRLFAACSVSPFPLFKNMQQETGLAVRSSTPFNRVYGRAMKKKIYL